MPAQKRGNPKTQVQTFRTIPLPEELRGAMKRRRAQLGLTQYEFIRDAALELEPLVAELARSLAGPPEQTRPARLPLDDQLIEAYREASQQTGIPATRLLVATLDRAAKRKRRRAVRK